MGFKIGDLYSETFIFQNGKKKGEVGVSLKARLLYIGWVKVEGDTVYTAPSKEMATEQTPENDDSTLTETNTEAATA